MKKVLFLVTYILILSSCCTPKKIESSVETKQTKQLQNDIREQNVESSRRETEKQTELAENTKTNTEVTETVYDTDKPVNPDTGKPPVIRETTTRTITETSTNSQDNESETFANSSQQNRSDNSQTQLDTIIIEDLKSDTKDPHKWRYIFGILVILCIAAYSIYNKFFKAKK